jgi:hypothetical protein
MLLLGITAAGAFALSFLCLQRPLTLVLSLSAAVVGGLVLSSGPQEAIPGWRYFWLLGVLTLAGGAVEFTLAYLRDGDSEPARSFVA